MTSQYQKRKTKSVKPIVDSQAVESSPENPKPNFDKTGHDVFYDNEKRKFIRVDIEYCLTTGSARVKNVDELADSQPVATYKMQELLARKILGIK